MNRGFSSLIKHDPHTLIVDGFSVVVHNGVFTPDPALTHSPYSIIHVLPDLHDKDVLDLGCGSGVLSLAAARRGASSVLAVDVSFAALENAQANIRTAQLDSRIQVKESDVFSNISEEFDLILANLPILDDGLWGRSPLEIVEKFLDEFPNHLKDAGEAWLVWGSFSPVEPLLSLLRGKGLSYRASHEMALGYEWSLFRIQKPVNH